MTPHYEDDALTLHHGDALEILRGLPDGSVDCCVTSPPYFGLRDYGVPPTKWPEVSYSPMPGVDPVTVPAMSCPLGLEPDVIAYVGHLLLIFHEVQRVLTVAGTLWLNLGDSYAGKSNAGESVGETRGRARPVAIPKRINTTKNAPYKSQLQVPARSAMALVAAGWTLRSDVIWSKPNSTPESVIDRPTSSHEYVFMFAKSRRYFYDASAIAEQATGRSSGNGFARPERINRGGAEQEDGWHGRPQLRRAIQIANTKGLTEEHFAAIRAAGMSDTGKAKEQQSGAGRNTARVLALAAEAKQALGGYYREFLTGATRNARSVWTIPTASFTGAHFAVMPLTLAERCVRAGCKPDGVVLDPFSGTGTTGLAAARSGRRYVGIELSTEHLEMSLETRLAQIALDFEDAAQLGADAS